MKESTKEISPIVPGGKKSLNPIKRIFGFVKAVGDFTGETVSATTFNMMNSVLGCGILFLPMVLQKMGIVLGTIFIVGGVLLMGFYVTLGVAAVKKSITDHGNKFPTIESYALHVFGKWFYYIIKVTFMLNLVSILIGYGIVMVETLLSVLEIENDDPRRFYVGMALFFFENIICMVDKIRDFKLISYVSCAFDFIFIFVAFYLFFNGDVQPVGEIKLFPKTFDVATVYNGFTTLGLVVFSAWNMIYVSAQNEAKPKDQYKVTLSVYFSYAIILIFNLSMAYVGYFSFLDGADGNIVLCYQGTTISVLLRLLIFFAIFLTYPLFNYLSAVAIDEILLFIFSLFQVKEGTKKKMSLRGKAKALKENCSNCESDFSSDDMSKQTCIPAKKPNLSFNILPSFLVRGVKECVSTPEPETSPLLMSDDDDDENAISEEIVLIEKEEEGSVESSDDDDDESESESGGGSNNKRDEELIKKNLRTKMSTEVIIDREKFLADGEDIDNDDDKLPRLKDDNIEIGNDVVDNPSKTQRFVRFLRLAFINTVCCICIYFVVMYYPNSGAVLAFVGSLFGTFIGIVFPAMIYLKVVKMNIFKRLFIINLTIIATIALGIIPTGISIYELFEDVFVDE